MTFVKQRDSRFLALGLGFLLLASGCASSGGYLRPWWKSDMAPPGVPVAQESGNPTQTASSPSKNALPPLESNLPKVSLTTPEQREVLRAIDLRRPNKNPPSGVVEQQSFASTMVVPPTDGAAQEGTVTQTSQIVPPAPMPEGIIPKPPGPSPEALPITLNMVGVDVRQALEMLSRESTKNVLVSPGVSGSVTINLRDVTFEQALTAILRLCNLQARREADIIYIYTPQELAELNQQQLDGPKLIRVYRLNYTRSTDVARMIRPFLSPTGKLSQTPQSQVGIDTGGTSSSGGLGGSGGASGGGSGGSGGGASGGSGGGSGGSGGSGGGSTGGSTGGTSGGAGGAAGGGASGGASGGDSMAGGDFIMVQDYEPILKTIDRLIAQLDVQPVQVLIEAVIMTVLHTNSQDLGINYAVLDGAGRVLGSVGNGAAINAAAGFDPTQVLAAGTPLQTLGATLATQGGKLAGSTSSGFAEAADGLKFGFVDNNLTGFIRALEQVGQTSVLASPRLLVLNKQRAELQLGDRLGFRTLTQTQTSTIQKVEFLNVGTQLFLRPFISSDGMVRMEIHPERSSGSVIDNIPQTSTSQITTNVMVPDGSTIVIGGLMENIDDNQISGVPGLSRLPWVGPLFRAQKTTCNRKELIVLITPRIWKPTLPQAPPYPPGPSLLVPPLEEPAPVIDVLPSPISE